MVVTDGFSGNVVLKFYESMGDLVRLLLERREPRIARDAGDAAADAIPRFSEYGGAPLLGVRGVPIICHGASRPNAIRNAIRKAIESVEGHLTEHIADELAAQATPPAT